MRLGQALAETGGFTRYPSFPTFIPDVIRTPGYPLFVAAVYRIGGEGHLPVAIAQAVVFAGIALLAYGLARFVAGDDVAFIAGMATALYPTLPYFGALTLTEVVTTFLITLGMYCWLGTLHRKRGAAVACGLVLAAAALTRPSFQYLPVALALFAAAFPLRKPIEWRRAVVMLAVYAAAVTPWALRNYRYFHEFAIAPPAAGIGRTMWEGNWQVAFPGRVQATLTHMAESIWNRSEVDAAIESYARSVQRDPQPMLQYVHEWQTMRRMWDDPQDPPERSAARAAADVEYGRLARANIRRDPVGHLWRRLTRGVPLLWITDIPVRYSDINRLPPWIIRGMWGIQLLIMLAAGAGLYVLSQHGRRAEAAAFAALILNITAVHAVLHSESRYALPAKPIVLLLATMAVSAAVRRLPPSQSHRTE
jgi:4-amino-4-deoxy-L-arabinose transferase-like glycosyltransferase